MWNMEFITLGHVYLCPWFGYYLGPISTNCPNTQNTLKTKINILWSKQWGDIGVGPLTLSTNRASQVFCKCNCEIKFNKYYTIHVKQHNVGIFIFKFTLKYMLSDVINKIHARQCLYYVFGKDSLLYPKESFMPNLKTARKNGSNG